MINLYQILAFWIGWVKRMLSDIQYCHLHCLLLVVPQML